MSKEFAKEYPLLHKTQIAKQNKTIALRGNN